ncbi:hypothetical protein [Nocardioides sp. R-C-SC26]|uniref:hypothetical protein n=1 Tax=Nocardioides sp. R-C-SC26 TaxID=2870414 RepID=UPI001E2A15FF|nr:hypothetical protein [Nocardioides sp. R-C-SC26]
MSERTPERVRVTGPDRRARPRPRTGDIDEETPLGRIYLASLLRDQLWLAARILAVLGITIGSIPLLAFVAPGVVDVHVAGVPVIWLVLGVAVYPWLVLLGWRYVRAAERNEDAFVDLVSELER